MNKADIGEWVRRRYGDDVYFDSDGDLQVRKEDGEYTYLSLPAFASWAQGQRGFEDEDDEETPTVSTVATAADVALALSDAPITDVELIADALSMYAREAPDVTKANRARAITATLTSEVLP